MRKVKRWVAECDFVTDEGACDFNERTKKELHISFAKAEAESYQHALAEGHIGAKEVTVERKYRLESEEIVST
jgi:hypothetical protein